MANVNILGAINSSDSDYTKLHTYGQAVIYAGLQQILGDHNDDMAMVEGLFVEGTTWEFQTVYKLPGQGRLQRRGVQSRAGEVKTSGEWTVGFPLEDFGADIAISTVDWAYMDAREFNRYVGTVLNQDRNTRRFEVLKAFFNNTARTFIDLGGHFPNTTVQPLAIGSTDSVLYPPVIGSEANATSQHYLGVAADSQTLTDANSPIAAVVNLLEGHFGTPNGGSDIVIFINNAQTASVQALAGFNVVPNRFVSYGDNVSLVEVDGIPITVGRVIGEVSGALIVEWRWIPAGYMFGMHYGAPKPLMKRMDPPDTGLEPGLQMQAEDMEFPFLRYAWTDRFGYGVGNRLNGVAVDLTAAGGASTYTIPTRFA